MNNQCYNCLVFKVLTNIFKLIQIIYITKNISDKEDGNVVGQFI